MYIGKAWKPEMRTAEEYKALSIKEFTKAAQVYETDKAGVYKMCEDDYPPILEELKKLTFRDLLDAGCGTAPMLTLLRDEFPEAHFVGLDLTPEMIAKAKEKNLPNTELYVGDCENMPFEANSFDVIINSQSFHHYPNPQDFFNSVARVLRPGGTIVMRDDTTKNKFIGWLANHIELPLANLIGKGDVKMHTLEEVQSYCDNAGLVVDKLEARKKFRLHLVAHLPQ